MADENQQKQDNITSISGLPGNTKIGGRKDWGNKLVVNTGRTPVVNFAFMLRVEGVFDLPCKAVKGIHRENEFDYIQEGGLNDYVHLKRKPISKPFTFQVERYVGVNWVDPLPLGTELLLPVILFVNKHVFPGLQPVRNYVFTGCTVISKDYGELNAEVSGLLLETVTIAYREMVCLDIPSETFEQDKNSGKVWKFDGKKREGSGDRHYNSNLYNKEWETSYSSRKKMEEKAEAGKWTPQKDTDGRLKNKHGKNYESFVTDYNKAIDQEIASATTEEEKEAAKAKKIAMSASTKRLWPEQSSATRQEMKTPDAKQYQHSEKAKQYSSAKHLEGEPSRSDMEQKADADRWKPEKDTDGHLKTKHGRDYKSFATDFNKEIEAEIKTAETEEAKQEAEAKRIALSAAANRIWPEQSSATKQAMKTPDGRVWPEQSSAIKKEMKTPDGRVWPEQSSATKKEMKTPDGRSWPEQSSATKKEMKTPDGRAWPEQSSATKQAMKTPDGRSWPEQSSATRQEMKTPDGRSWPEQSSATRQEMKTPEARLWPAKKSAKQITDFLKKH